MTGRIFVAVLLGCAVVVPSGVAAAGPAATTCPRGGLGGPFLRICSNPLSKAPSGPYTTVGAYGTITLPCSTKDLKTRQYYDKSGNPTKTTTDAGYAYFATYAPGDEVEVGYVHNPHLPFNGYSLYVRHDLQVPKHQEKFWNEAPAEAQPCGKTILLEYLIGYDHNNASVDVVLVQSGAADGSSGATYSFAPTPGQTTMEPTETSWTGGKPHPAGGKGSIAVLTEAAWQNGCEQCTVGMLTAIGQNAPGGAPVDPLEDGASFGPVSWDQLALDDHVDQIPWTSTVTASTRVWEHGITTVAKTGGPPTYTVTNLQVPCVPSTTGNDQWSC